jgi:hypothetical protein
MEPVTDLEILIPIEEGHDPVHLAACLRGIVESTIVRSYNVIGIVVGKGVVPTVFQGSACTWHVRNYDLPLLSSMRSAIEDAKAIHVAVVRPSYAIADKAWFGKMQLPFLRVPNCGLTVACDDQKGTGAQPFQIPLGWTPGHLVFGAQKTLTSIARQVPDSDDGTYTDALLRAAASLGLAAWAVPGVRLSICGATTSHTRAESPNAHRPG